jgi:hypothetical protein
MVARLVMMPGDRDWHLNLGKPWAANKLSF